MMYYKVLLYVVSSLVDSIFQYYIPIGIGRILEYNKIIDLGIPVGMLRLFPHGVICLFLDGDYT
jgi:hypothetical protein